MPCAGRGSSEDIDRQPSSLPLPRGCFIDTCMSIVLIVTQTGAQMVQVAYHFLSQPSGRIIPMTISSFKKLRDGLERWLRGYEHTVLVEN